MLANKLLALHSSDVAANERIVRQLTRELLSHDYVISRREAKDIGMPLADASDEEAELMWKIYEAVAIEMHLGTPWNWESEAQETQPRSVTRAVLQSSGLKHEFTSTYQIRRITGKGGKGGAELQITQVDEGSWREV